MVNPILIEVTRGPLVESWHRGAIAVAFASGAVALQLGDVVQPIYPRSSIKALQALPFIETGAADHFGFGAQEIALACASHTGTEHHTRLVAAMLERIGLNEEALGCGPHMPLGGAAAKALNESHRKPTQLHNNCSGKHAGMLATALYLGEPIAGYWQIEHPVQQRILHLLVEMSGVALGPDVTGFDGCSVPNWAMPLSTLAHMFARFATRNGLAPKRRLAVERILAACWEHPELIAGKGCTDSVVMGALPGRVFLKTGAEGVYCGAFPELGLGFALKIDDGTKRAAAGATMALVERFYPLGLGPMNGKSMKTWSGMEVGAIRSSAAFENALGGLKS